MPPNPNMQNISSQLEMMQQAQSAQAGLFAGSMASLQQTIQSLTDATKMGVMTARNSGSVALGSLQYGAATAIGDLQSIGSSIQAITPGAGPAPMVGGQILAAGGGMQVGSSDIVHGVSTGVINLGGVLGGFAGWEAVAGLGRATGIGIGSFTRGGAAAGRVLMGGGALGGAGAIAGGAMGAAAAIALPLAAAAGVEYIAEQASMHLGAVRDIDAIMKQQMWRNAPFDPNVDPSRTNYRRLAENIAGDISGMRGFDATSATQIVGMGMELGLFQGATGEGGQGIRARAKELAEAVKDVSRLVGTSLQESLTVMAEVKQAGFDPTSAAGVIVQSRGLGMAGGFTAAEMHMTGMRGAQMFRGLGVSPTFGFNAAQQSLAMASNLTLTGAVPQWLQASMGGRQAMGETMTQGVANFLHSPMGNVFAAALNAPGGAGNLAQPFEELGAAAARGVGTTPGEYVNFLANKRRLVEEAGPEAVQAFRARTISQAFEREVLQNDPTYRETWDLMTKSQRGERIGEYAAARFVGSMGIGTADEARVLGQLAANPQTFDSQRQALKSEMHRASMDRYMEEHGPVGWARRNITDPLGRNVQVSASAIARPFTAIGEEFEETTRDISNWMYGIERRSVSASDVEAAAKFETSGLPRGRRHLRISAPEVIQRFTERGLVQEISREEYQRGEDEFVLVGPPSTSGTLRAVRKVEIDKDRQQAGALRQVLLGNRKFTEAEDQAVNAAFSRVFKEQGLGEYRATQIDAITNTSFNMENRVANMRELISAVMPGEGSEGYENLPGETFEEKKHQLMNKFGKTLGVHDVLARAAKNSQIESVTDPTAVEKDAIAKLDKNIEDLTEKYFGTTWNDDAQRNVIKANIRDIQKVATGKITGIERLEVAQRLAKAGGGSAAQILKRIESDSAILTVGEGGTISAKSVGLTLVEAVTGVEAKSRQIISERLETRLEQSAESIRERLAKGGKLTAQEESLIGRLEDVGSASELRTVLGDFRETAAFVNVVQANPFLARAAKLLPATGNISAKQIQELLVSADVGGTEMGVSDPTERAKVREFTQVNAMFQTTHRSMSRLASATAILLTEVQRSGSKKQPNSNSSPSMPAATTVVTGD